jgi:micrococcal nuclease
MKHAPLLRSHVFSGRSLRKAVNAAWSAPAIALILVMAWSAAVVGVARAAEKRIPSSPPATPEVDRLLLPDEPAEVHPWGTVRTVLDGTSLVVVTPDLMTYEVRLLGVEPPEPPRPARSGAPAIAGQPFGPEAAAYLRDLVTDKQVQLDTYGKDRAGRTLAVVWLGEINVNLTLVKEGLAWVAPNVTVTRVRVELEVAERQARVGKYGLWALPDPEPPWEFRKRHNLPAE